MTKLYTKNWEINNVNAILVDKDGTFVDSNPYWGKIVALRIKAIISNYKINPVNYEKLCLTLGYDINSNTLIDSAPIALLSRDEIIKLIIKELKNIQIQANYNDISEIFNNVHEEFLPEMYKYIVPIKEAESFFIRMKEAGIKLCVVTSDIQLNAIKTTEHLGFTKYFDFIIGKDNCTKDKKTGEPAEVALKLLGEKKENVISLGDAPMDYEMAKNANLLGSILVSTGQLSEQTLKKYTDTTISNLDEIKIKI